MGRRKIREEELARGLNDRHIQLIAIGGAIGVGLFLGSAQAIQLAGPAILLAYAIGGMIMFFLMRALGELALYKPVAGSFSTYASEFIAPWVGFVTGWNYWIVWVVTGMAEITAVGVYVRYWFPEIPQWIPALGALLGVYIINIIAVKLFGEFEFWFAMIKVVTIIALIVIGLVIMFTGWGNGGQIVGFSNLWTHGGFVPHGVTGILLSLQMVMFSFLGMELIGVTAGEAKDPEITLPRAINATIWRILLFYIGALAVILSLYPWNIIDGNTSPFVLTFAKVGIPAAAGIINFVVLTAALSSCNSGVFSTGRMIYTLAVHGQAPQMFSRLSSRKVPVRGLTLSAVVMLIGVLLNYVIPEKAFIYITSVATFGALWTWGIIVYAHLNYRRKRGVQVEFKMPGYPYTNWITLLFMVMVAVLLGFNSETRIALIVGPIWILILIVSYQFVKKYHRDGSRPGS
ncbi:AAT family amino acid transporter/D-serine/D-alanine/glycine transporter [Planifilum fimeticola]|jgi:AAT family amino acid transporter|uniref:AAT family amino acid transporter/D-serine/D-alanine/glycine transporter n=1 Tax=Planifilum fimeticola TaxID=201975 RepID=A0A2T0LCC4_9BACL|nr:amino acid permease [Planifilum fimeticola]PRX39594.1 AAT family amino acid transporter/D-serine/D-alanine/glycine transporter [Planifilum fimeticola]